MADRDDVSRAGADGREGDLPDVRYGVPDDSPSHVHRADVLAALAAGDAVPLVVVSAPAGTGKSVAVAQWARRLVGTTTCWATVEDAESFSWGTVLDALRTVGLPVPEDWMVPLRGGLGPQRLRALAEIIARAGERTVLVLDGHELGSATLAREVDALLRRTRGRLTVVFVGRVDPVVLLHRYRLTESVTELRTRDLCFSDEEAARLLRLAGVVLPDAAVHELNARLSGWAAGLRFAARALGASASPEQFVDTVVEQTADINEFLVGEVLDAESPEVRQFLLDTCVTDVFSAEFVELTGGATALGTLHRLLDRGGFLESVPGHPGRFRYFPFYKNLLLARLAYEAPERLVELRRAAAAWYRQEGRMARSLAELAKIGDWEQLCHQVVLDGLVAGLLLEDRGGPLGDLARQLPPDVESAEAHLVRAAVALGLGDSGRRRCARELVRAKEAIEDHDAAPELVVAVAAADALRSSLTDDCDTAARAVDEAERLIAGSPIFRSEEDTSGLGAVVVFSRGVVALRSGDLARARAALARAADEATRRSAGAFRADCLGRLALAEAVHGSLVAATHHAEEALSITGPPHTGPHEPPPSAHLALAWVGVERCDDDLLADHSTAVAATESIAADPFCCVFAQATAALLERARGHTASALASLQASADAAARRDPWLSDLLRVEAARLSVATGDPDRALAVLDSVQLPGRPEPQVLTAAALVRQGRSPDVENLSIGDESASLSSQVGAHLVEATAAAQHRSRAQARTALTRALRLAAPQHLRRPFRDTGTTVDRLLEGDTGLTSVHEWLRQDESQPHGARESAPEWVVVDPLTPKELEVLTHLAELLSTEEIAEKMFVSVNTVRTHIRNILHKLGVSRRNGAIRRARELGLLDGDRW